MTSEFKIIIEWIHTQRGKTMASHKTYIIRINANFKYHEVERQHYMERLFLILGESRNKFTPYKVWKS